MSTLSKNKQRQAFQCKAKLTREMASRGNTGTKSRLAICCELEIDCKYCDNNCFNKR